MNLTGNMIYKFKYQDGILKYHVRMPFHLLLGSFGYTINTGISINTVLRFEHQQTTTHQKIILYKYQHNIRKEGRLLINVSNLFFLPWDKNVPDLIAGLNEVLIRSSQKQNVGLLPVKEEAKQIALYELSKRYLIKGSKAAKKITNHAKQVEFGSSDSGMKFRVS